VFKLGNSKAAVHVVVDFQHWYPVKPVKKLKEEREKECM